jgi:hypothetical protein
MMGIEDDLGRLEAIGEEKCWGFVLQRFSALGQELALGIMDGNGKPAPHDSFGARSLCRVNCLKPEPRGAPVADR